MMSGLRVPPGMRALRPITYTIAFEGNGARPSSPGMQDMTASYEVPAALAIVGVKFTREAYVFDGWNTAADGTGTAYADGATVVNLATVQDAVVRLYAQWRVVGYTITYDRNNDVRGSVTSPPNGALHKVDEPFMLGHRSRHRRDVASWLRLRRLVRRRPSR